MHTEQGYQNLFDALKAEDPRLAADLHGSRQPLGNGVTGLRIPQVALTKDALDATSSGIFGIPQGGKTLFPAGWTQADIIGAGQLIRTTGTVVATGKKGTTLVGKYKGVKVAVALDNSCNQLIKSVYPTWRQ
jgi:hypothetical protein